MGFYTSTIFYSNGADETAPHVVRLPHLDPIIEEYEYRRGYVLREEVLRVLGQWITADILDAATAPQLVEYSWSTLEAGSLGSLHSYETKRINIVADNTLTPQQKFGINPVLRDVPIEWESLCANPHPTAIEMLLANPDKIVPAVICANKNGEGVMRILRAHPDKIDAAVLYANPAIFMR